MYLDTIKDWELDEHELGIVLSPTYVGPFILNIPKLMPLIPVSSPSSSKSNINNVSINDKSCDFNSPNTISTQNFVTFGALRNYRVPEVMKVFGDEVICKVYNKNPRRIYVTDDF